MKKDVERMSMIAIGPDGKILTAATLPRSQNIKWVRRRKAEVVIAVDRGIITLADALRRYAMSEEEFLSWKLDYARGGLGASKRKPVHQSGAAVSRASHREPVAAG